MLRQQKHRPGTVTTDQELSPSVPRWDSTEVLVPPASLRPDTGRAGPGLVLLSRCILLFALHRQELVQEPRQKPEIQSFEGFFAEFEQPAPALRATMTSFWASAHGRLFSGTGAVPEPGVTPGKNYILLHQACIDRVNSRVAQKGNL